MILVAMFIPDGAIIMGIDDTIERRKGTKIKARGIYRDPVRSSHGHFVKVSGLRWLTMMLLVEIPWAQRVWALPFLTALAPSERYSQQYKFRHKTLVDWARQMMLQVKRWLPTRELVVVADSSFAALELLDSGAQTPFTNTYNYPFALLLQHFMSLHQQELLIQWEDLGLKVKDCPI
jgi:hypothetical protein